MPERELSIAFKEWRVVTDALAQGVQTIILRKGGIAEGRGGFQLEWDRFLLFPTRFHQQGESVVAEAEQRLAELGGVGPEDRPVEITAYAEVVEAREVRDLEAAQRLEGQHIWRPEVIASRFDWGRSKSIFAIAVRVHRLAAPRTFPMIDAYGGCKSWIELEAPVDISDATPSLDDRQFDERLQAFRHALGS